ncbi:C39 family peptidase [Deinococcus arboris]|uniref:C39 family peptidase n=1 Tax=Deinococcus arboris TaxID=2682977 RepID=UPI0034E29E43
MSPLPSRLLIHDTPAAWTGAQFNGVTQTPQGLTVDGPEGTILSPTLTALPFDQLLPSWNATLTAHGTCTVDVRVRRTSGDWTRWWTFGTWTPSAERTSLNHQQDEDGRVLTDTLSLQFHAEHFQYRVHLTGQDSTLRLLAFCTTDHAQQQATVPRLGRPEHWGTELALPQRSQMVHEGGSGWCSPTCLSMVLHSLGTDHSVPETAAAVFDQAYGGAGNWAFNVAHAGQLGYRAYLTRLLDLQAAEDELARGVAPILSVAWQAGELPGAPVTSSDGHLVVLRGFDSQGDPVIHDPAASTDAEVRRVYPRQAFEQAWLGHSGGLAYLISPA